VRSDETIAANTCASTSAAARRAAVTYCSGRSRPKPRHGDLLDAAGLAEPLVDQQYDATGRV
jgi:hypothetical protein